MNASRSNMSLYKSSIRIIVAISIVVILLWIYIAQPTTTRNSLSEVKVNAEELKYHVIKLSNEFYPRNHKEIANLNRTAAYIENHFRNTGGHVEIQEFEVSGEIYKNIIVVFGKGKGRKVVVGAHYDAFMQTYGADDNASGIAGLIELAHILGRSGIEKEIELVAYSLEEPPHFGSTKMGSYAHAEKIKKEKIKIEGVIILEMIGYFTDEWGSQSYPNPLLYLLYPNQGNFVAVVGRLDQRQFTKNIKVAMNGSTDLPVYSINGPESLPGIDFSDHRNYWPLGINAVMVTDTGFYRNSTYHKLSDTSEKLDYKRMAKAVIGVFEAIKEI